MNYTDKHLLIDADTLVYRAGFAAEKVRYVVETPEGWIKCDSFKDTKKIPIGTIWSHRDVEPVGIAVKNLKNIIQGITGALWPGKDEWTGEFFLSGKVNFRDLVAKRNVYKGNRDSAHKPKHYNALREELLLTMGAIVSKTCEADDEIGITARILRGEGTDYVIVTNDKDLDQIPGWHYNWVTKLEPYYVDEVSALKFFYRQLLSGDRVDNVKGVVSENKARTLVEGCSSIRECAQIAGEEYKKYFGSDNWHDPLEEVANLVYILRDPDETKRGRDQFWYDYNGT